MAIAESDLNDPRLLRPLEAGGLGLHAQWNDDFHHALHGALTGPGRGYAADFGRLEHLARALTHGYVYDGVYAPNRGRTHGRRATGVPGRRFVGYLQSHDQIANQAGGERTVHLVSPGLARVAAALVLTATSSRCAAPIRPSPTTASSESRCASTRTSAG